MTSESRPDIRTPVTILSGFLGSGKTTMLNRILNDLSMTQTAVVINEFGQVSIDHLLTTTSDDTIMVLENGCLCCTVFGDLVQTLNRLYHARAAGEIAFEQVIIETSGLADVAPVVQAFLSEPTLEGLYRVDGLISTFDAVNGPHTLQEHTVSVRQLALADNIVITKLDMLAAAEQAPQRLALTALLRSVNSTAAISAADDPGLDLHQLVKRGPPAADKGSGAIKNWLDVAISSAHASRDEHHGEHGSAHGHDSSIATFCLIREQPLHRDALQLLLNSLEKHLGPSLLRVKGLVNVAEQPTQPAVIQGAQHLLHNLTWLAKWPDDDHRTRIVFITQGIDSAELSELVTLLDRVAERTAKARLRAEGEHVPLP
jgi:G3E family GTPase